VCVFALVQVLLQPRVRVVCKLAEVLVEGRTPTDHADATAQDMMRMSTSTRPRERVALGFVRQSCATQARVIAKIRQHHSCVDESLSMLECRWLCSRDNVGIM
jgi:hypothetical protein